MSYKSSVKKCNEMLALAKAGTTIWWRREGFHQEPFQGTEPKWHVLTGRFSHRNNPEMQPDDDPVWTALCGYRKGFDDDRRTHLRDVPEPAQDSPQEGHALP
jgi:hypothetical protein